MKHYLLIFTIVFITCINYSYSQDSISNSTYSLDNKLYSLQFQINQNFTLSNFQGAIISIKKNITNKSAIRVGVDFNAGYNNSKNNSISIDSTISTGKITYHSYSLNIQSQFLRYIKFEDNILPYYAVGPVIGYSFSKSKNVIKYENGYGDNMTTTISSSSDWRCGLSTSFGVEWFVKKKLSLLAEYNTTLIYVYSKTTNEIKYEYHSRVSESTSVNKGLQFNPNNIKFGLSLYF